MSTKTEYEIIKFLIGDDVNESCETAEMQPVRANGERVITTPPTWFRKQYANIFDE